MMQLSAGRETTLSWRAVGPFSEPLLVVGVLYHVLSAILRRPLCFLVVFCRYLFVFCFGSRSPKVC